MCAMLTDSNSPHNDYSNLCSWLAHPGTEEVLQEFQLRVDALQLTLMNVIPRDEYEKNLREQSIGEMRTLSTFIREVKTRHVELEKIVRTQN